MRLIAHRGNIHGPSGVENKIYHLKRALDSGFDVEVDIWNINGYFYLGHDEPNLCCKYEIDQLYKDLDFSRVWFHAKNVDALNSDLQEYNMFWQENDKYSLTTDGFIWCNIDNILPEDARKCVQVMPEYGLWNINKNVYAVCSDYVSILKDIL